MTELENNKHENTQKQEIDWEEIRRDQLEYDDYLDQQAEIQECDEGF